MAIYFNLPVYKVSYKLVFMLFQISGSFSREYKYTIGQDLKNEGTDLIKNIYHANKAKDKTAHITKANENLETVRLLIRLMQDFNQLGIKPFVEINQGIENVSKQLNAWGKYSAVKLSEVKTKENMPELSIARA